MSAERTWVQGRCPACGHGRTKMLGAAGNRVPLCSVPLSLLGHGGDAKEGCLPISATIQTPASPANPWTTSTRPSSLDLQGLQLALLGWQGEGA